MSEYYANIVWQKKLGEDFVNNKYSRVHIWEFDGGVQVSASSSPHIVPLPYSDELSVDPEEAFVASLSSCHMLWFLALAAKNKHEVVSYRDHAKGIMKKNQEGKLAITLITLRPVVEFEGDNVPSTERLRELHHEAHEKCFIANSIKTEVVIELA
ncbi:MAG: OsmC family protein [Acidobacteriota bacterium]